MKLKLFDFFKSVSRRFPVTAVLVVIASVILLTLIEDPWNYSSQTTYALGLTIVGIYLSAIWTIISGLMEEAGDIDKRSRNIATIIDIVLFGGITYLFTYTNVLAFDTLGGDFTGGIYKLLALVLISIVAVFVIPFRNRGNSDLWSFAFGLAKRALVSFLYAAVLAIGLSLALGALDWFWNITITDNQYESVVMLSYALVGLLHFVSGIPTLTKNAKWEELPKFLDIFAKFIVIPLSGVYTVIMYPYIFSLPFRTEWPPNQTTPTVLAFLGLGYGALFILYRGLSDKKDRFTKIYSRILGGISIPMVLFWMYSVYLRTAEYGLTVNRVVLMTLVLWTLGVSIYFLLIKESKVKWVFASLLLSMVVVIYLPFTSFYWSQSVQTDRLIDMAKVEDIYSDGMIGRKEEADNGSVAASMGETLAYLNTYHTLNAVEEMLDDDVLEKLDIDEYGYADIDYRGGEVFFDKYTYVKESPLRDEFITISADSLLIDIPEGFTTVQRGSIYPDEVSFRALDEIEFDVPKDSLVGVDLKEGEFGEFEASVEDLTLYDGEDRVFVIIQMTVSLEDEMIMERRYIEGFLFTK